LNTPYGFERVQGPGLAFFRPKGKTQSKGDPVIYINCAPVGPKEQDKSVESYIESDISGFQQHFKKGSVQKEDDVLLPTSPRLRAPAYTFRSGEENNAYERIVYIPENGRVLILVLSVKTQDALAKTLPVFTEFVTSYKGSIIFGEQK